MWYTNTTDIDECSDFATSPCHMCNNTEGSYNCTCNEGYTIESNGTILYCQGEYIHSITDHRAVLVPHWMGEHIQCKE